MIETWYNDRLVLVADAVHKEGMLDLFYRISAINAF
jgi:hypothetical protein